MNSITEKNGATPSPPTHHSGGEARERADSLSSGDEPPALARRAVEAYVTQRRIISARELDQNPALSQPAACFVSIKTTDRELRGCIGTIEPSYETLADEIIHNAISAATRDPRFYPVAESELSGLRFSVDVLGGPEETQFQELNPAVYGVIVEDESGTRRGLLLPDIEGVETPEQQVRIAARKAGIAPGTPLRLYRFRVTRFKEPGD
jgi:AmmeMemoRadiSam system protein A